jgi:hypothetical protein
MKNRNMERDQSNKQTDPSHFWEYGGSLAIRNAGKQQEQGVTMMTKTNPMPPTPSRLMSVFKLSLALVTPALVLALPATWAAAPMPSQQAYLKASNTGASDLFGYAVAVSDDTLVVGAIGESSNAAGANGDQSNNNAPSSGAAYVFVRSGGTWVQQAYLKASNPGTNHSFGISVAVSGDTIVVGAPSEASNATGVNGDQSNKSLTSAGAAYGFVRNGSNWRQQAYLKASNPGTFNYFGHSVAVSGDTVVVGALGEDSNATGVNGTPTGFSFESGAAYVFARSGTNWSQQAYLKASNTGAGDRFGYSVAVSGDTVLIGAWQESSSATGVNGNQNNNNAPSSGAAYVFVRSGTNWSQQAYLKASNTGADDVFGFSVAVSGDTAVVGGYGEDSAAIGINGNQADNSTTNSGAAYIFVRNGTIWSQQAYLKASNTGAEDQFGWMVAVSGDVVVVGAFVEDGSATGANGNGADNGATNSGAAYVFVRSGTNWSQRAYLKASNTAADDWFGLSVGVSGDTVVIGAIAEDSGATGIDGDESDKSATNAGAAYVFTGFVSRPRLAIEPDGNGGHFIRFDGVPGVTYRLQRAPNATGTWSDIATNTALASGFIEYHDTAPPPGHAFYRTAHP